ncbi:hypothetical protein [Reinekea sp. G2M2-21]|uniref:hypothetical protein n=1 Tax=Reinekea sp. G2M2-21 TaxID=2788942 RepID=UPI0018A942E9|nr:hypothetical protein [Reinekea sp. G2M2-21]
MNICFEVNGQRIAWPSGVSVLKDAKRILSQQFPMLRNTTIYEEDARLMGDVMVYPVVLPPVKTKG